ASRLTLFPSTTLFRSRPCGRRLSRQRALRRLLPAPLPREGRVVSADRLAALLARSPRLEPGHVWLAGAGPGAPGMLTLDVASARSEEHTSELQSRENL